MTTKNRNKIVLVNGKASCGCSLIFSNGHGEYSDIHTVNICDFHSRAELIHEVINTGALTRPQHEELESRLAKAAMIGFPSNVTIETAIDAALEAK